ncbi:hypothetical protein [Ruegeria atlantica]|uniref:hypothetical protein n=1 Tax=Ruegeria atlantica TaxID=81569 RepID=UPI002494E13F|nr:hypothetical protein [Ruegeria atlantica]
MTEVIVALAYLFFGAKIWRVVVLPNRIPDDQAALEWHIEASEQERSGDPVLLVAKATVVLFWPAFMFFGFVAAKLQE